jgi:hypothetical protein
MLKTLGVAASTLAFFVLVPGAPAFADHVSSKRKASAQAAGRVEDRLVNVGMDREAARDEVASMTASDVSYFSADAERIQVVAGLTSEEFFVGGGFLGLMSLLTLFLILNSKGT